MERAIELAATKYEERYDDDRPPDPRVHARYGAGPGPHVAGSRRSPEAQVEDAIRGEVLDSPDTAAAKKESFELRRRGLPYSEIADLLGVPEATARHYVKEKLRSIQDDELADTELARRMQLEQLEEMIRAIHAPATGRHQDGSYGAPILEAMDRMMKLLAQKAKLLGLDAPQRVDITHRLQLMADESGYDIEELEELAAQVLKELHDQGALRG